MIFLGGGKGGAGQVGSRETREEEHGFGKG